MIDVLERPKQGSELNKAYEKCPRGFVEVCAGDPFTI